MSRSRMLGPAKDRIVATLARSHVVGPSVDDAIRVGQREAAAGAAVTLGPWTARGEAPAEVVATYRRAVAAIAEAQLRSTVSIKLPDIGFDEHLLTQLLAEASTARVPVHLDSLRPDTADRTLELLPAIVAIEPDVGVTLPGRWTRSVEDAQRVVDAGVRSVRVVKGQWADPEHPKRNPVTGVLEVVDRLLGKGAVVGVATHDPRLALAAVERLVGAGTACRSEQLYGLPRLDLHHRFGIGLLVYVPYGAAYLPYALSQTLRRPRMLGVVARDLIRSRATASPVTNR